MSKNVYNTRAVFVEEGARVDLSCRPRHVTICTVSRASNKPNHADQESKNLKPEAAATDHEMVDFMPLHARHEDPCLFSHSVIHSSS